MSRRELKTVMRQIHRDKKFTFKPSLTPLTERLAESARYHNKSISQTNIKIQSRQAFPNQNTSRSSSQIQDAILETKSAQQLPQPKKRKRWEDLHDNHKIYQERIDKQKQELLQYRMSIEIQDCTFKPNTVKTPVSKKVSQDFSSHLTKQSGISPLRANDIFERNLKWKNEIKQKIQVKQDEVKKAEMEGVTFQPEITNFDKNSLQANSKTQLESNMKAIDLYVKRIQKAKEENERKSKIIYSNKTINQTYVSKTVLYEQKYNFNESKERIIKQSNTIEKYLEFQIE
ncbi:UNKNOWN [Stylonychia lemnae]|uniref:Uncharacterized protein n=1 Tax=Stylonychia lemnae TaxID=5949 RepID=A0A078B1D5_STYLE|nr:UNKNOWN [Stylonychia lemnae]|eukprot:CDW88375.1 UNKNOWN [Stylonychia lemnae]